MTTGCDGGRGEWGAEIGLGPIVWVLLSEMYPLAVRGVAMSVGATANWVFTFIVGLLFPVLKGT